MQLLRIVNGFPVQIQRSTRIVLVSVIVATLTVITVFDGPVLSCIIGGLAAGMLMYVGERLRQRR